jgi:ech hydrogenase subunit D
MSELLECVPIQASELPALAAARLRDNWRLVLVTALQAKQPAAELEITYSFERGQKVENLRLRLDTGSGPPTLPSITGTYMAAFTYENELQDLFGVKMEGLNPDYQGRFYSRKGGGSNG